MQLFVNHASGTPLIKDGGVWMSANFHRLSPQLKLFSYILFLARFHSIPQIPSRSVRTIAMATETAARERAIVSQGSLGLIAHEVCFLTRVHARSHTRESPEK